VTQSTSQTLTRTRTQTRSQAATPSQTPTITATPSQSPSPSQTISPSESQSPSSAPTPSQTQTPSVTGFPPQTVLDNTNAGLNGVDSAFRVLTATTLRAVSFYLPESDPVCGPGTYRLQTLTLALGGATGAVSIAVLLYPSDPTTALPDTASGFLRSTVAAFGPVQLASAAYLTVPLPPSWTIDATQQRYFSLVIRTTGAAVVNWFDASDGVADHVPRAGFAQPTGAFASVDGGAVWAMDVTYGSVALTGQKLVCRCACVVCM
jgi:hypothetical protein